MENRLWKILLVEDDEDDYVLTRTLLNEAKPGGVELVWASTYSSALDYLKKCNYDVILVDYLLGEHNGLELVRTAVEMGCKAPIIVLTGAGSYEIDVEAMKVGAVDYLVKGQINASLLERTIRYTIERKQAEEALQQANDRLEQRVEERTRELAAVNEELRAEIQERKRAEEALISSEEKFRTLAETTSTAIFMVQGMKICYANSAARFITGYSPAELQQMEFWQLAHTTYQKVLKDRGVINHWVSLSQEGNDSERVPTRYELKLVTKGGEERWADVTVGEIEYEKEQAYIITAFDITERDLAEQELRKAKSELEDRVVERTAELQEANQRLQVELVERKRSAEERERLLAQVREERRHVEELALKLEQERDNLQTTMENTHTHLAYFDPQFNFVRVNSAYCKGAGRKEDQLIGRNHFELFPDEENQAIFQKVLETRQPAEFHAKPFKHPTANGAELTYWDWTLVPVIGAFEQVQGLVFSLLDVTEQKKAEQQRERHLASLNTLIQVSKRILAENNLDGLLQQIADAAVELTGAKIGLSWHGLKDNAFITRAAAGLDDITASTMAEFLNNSQTQLCQMIQERESTVWMTRDQLDQVFEPGTYLNRPSQLREVLGARLSGRDGKLNGIILVSNKDQGEFSEEDEALLAQLATLASLGLQHIEAREDAERRADELDATFSALVDVVIVYDAQGKPLRANPAAVIAYGYDPTHTQTVELQDSNGTSIRPYLLEDMPFNRVLAGDTVKDERVIFTDAGGRQLTILASASPIYKDGEVSGAVAVWHDVTEREQLLAQLEAERARLSTVIANAPSAILVADERGEIALINPVAEQISGKPLFYSGSSENDQLPQFFHVDGKPCEQSDHPLMRSALFGESEINLEMSLRWPEGYERYFLINSAPILDRRGKIQGAVAIFQDITQRKEAEVELRKARDELELRVQERTRQLAKINQDLRAEIQERLRAEETIRENAARSEALAEISQELVEAGHDFQAVLDIVAQNTANAIGDACIIRLLSAQQTELELCAFYHPNPEAHQILGETLPNIPLDVEEGIQGQVFRTGQPVLLPSLPEELLSSIQASQLESYLSRFGFASILIVPMTIRAQVIGTLEIYRDTNGKPYTNEDLLFLQSLAARTALTVANIKLYIDLENSLQTEQSMRRQLVQAEKHSAMSRMVASVAHELNNPVQTIQNCLFLTHQDLDKDSPIHEFLDMATSEARRVSNLVAQLREIYRPSKTTPMGRVDLNAILANVQVLMAPHLQHQHVQWTQRPMDGPVIVAGIPDQIKQVFLNISLNAVEAMQPHGGNLVVQITYSPDCEKVGIAFKDTGPGISAENLSRLFDPFFTTKDFGTGLGLSICYDIIHRHNGEISVDSQPGHGSTFTVWLPLLPAEG